MQEKILAAIIEYITEHGYSPTVREIGDAVGLRSPATVHGYLEKMFDDGILETDAPRTPRAIRVPGYEFIKTGGN